MPIIKTYSSNEEAFQELTPCGYIQSSGSQYINTNASIFNKINHRILFDVSFNSFYNYNSLFGSSYDNDTFEGWCYNDGGFSARYNGSYYSNKSVSLLTNTFYTIDLRKTSNQLKCYFNNELKYSSNCSQSTNNASLSIMLSGGDYGKLKLKSCKIYADDIDTDILIRDYQPVVFNNVGYLYDKVEHKLYGNDGTGSFTYPSVHISTSVNPLDSGKVQGGGYFDAGSAITLNAIANKGHKFLNWLLKGYTRLEYIESTGSQYIQLPFGFNRTDEIEITGAIKVVAGDKYLLAPSSWNTNNNRFAMLGDCNSELAIGFGSSETNKTLLSPYLHASNYVGKVITQTYKNNIFSCEGSTCDVSGISFGSETSNLKLFYGYNSATSGIIHYLKYIKNGTLYSFIPVIRHSDGAIGLLDLVNLKFYGNSGSGTFIGGITSGGEIKNPPNENIYLEDNPLNFTAAENVEFQANFKKKLSKRYLIGE